MTMIMKTRSDSERRTAEPSDVHAIVYCEGFPEHCAMSYETMSGKSSGEGIAVAAGDRRSRHQRSGRLQLQV